MKNVPRKSKRWMKCWSLIFLLAVMAVPSARIRKSRAAGLQQAQQRPNFLIIMTDDQSHDTMNDMFMPNVKAMIADQGITFSRGYMSTALCCPSRSCFLTGQYARHTGVHTNSDQLTEPTVANVLQPAGYYTGLIGKYLNSWPGDARPEYNFWSCWVNGYTNPKMNIAGQFENVPGYLTYILRDQALQFLDQVPADQPFFLLFTPHAPHAPATPAPGDENLYSDLPKWRPPSFNPIEQNDKPVWLQNTPLLTNKQIKNDVDEFRLNQLRCLHSVDLAVKDVLDKLQAQGKLDNTFIVFYSDNGYFWGEHRLLHKNRVYEEASHGPFALRYKPLVTAPRQEDRLVEVIDLAATMYDLAGVQSSIPVDGQSLVPLMQGTTNWRDALFLEGWPNGVDNTEEQMPFEQAKTTISEHYQAIRLARWVYVETDNDTPELYDTDADPFQMNNLASDPQWAKKVKQLSVRLHQFQ